MQYQNEKAAAHTSDPFHSSALPPQANAPPPAPNTSTTAKGKRASRYLNLKRLPTLQEVLDRRTRAPLDLFCFYVSCHTNPRNNSGVFHPCSRTQIYLQRESSEDALDFWLDVQQHENLCKAYFKVTSLGLEQ